ncbi:MAG TPA: MarR family winged helix-turn-helix transcriptional regulator [Gaiellales bacterium]|jgi:DNA-binding MarR family transcriptional regulator
MEPEPHWSQDMPMPVLLAEARLAYVSAIRRAFAEAGFDDMPRAGARVIGRIAVGGTNVNDVAAVYGVSKQAASQLVDSLVARGYVERAPDPEDRRRMVVALTERGSAAAGELRAAIEGVDAALASAFAEDELIRARRVLGTLVALHHGEPGDEEPA